MPLLEQSLLEDETVRLQEAVQPPAETINVHVVEYLVLEEKTPRYLKVFLLVPFPQSHILDL